MRDLASSSPLSPFSLALGQTNKKRTSRSKNHHQLASPSLASSTSKISSPLIISPGPKGSWAKNLRTGLEARSFVDPESVNSPLLMRSSSDASAGRAPTSSSRRGGADGSVSGAAAALISRRVAPLVDVDEDKGMTPVTSGAR